MPRAATSSSSRAAFQYAASAILPAKAFPGVTARDNPMDIRFRPAGVAEVVTVALLPPFTYADLDVALVNTPQMCDQVLVEIVVLSAGEPFVEARTAPVVCICIRWLAAVIVLPEAKMPSGICVVARLEGLSQQHIVSGVAVITPVVDSM